MLLGEGAQACGLAEKISLISEVSVAAGQRQSSVCLSVCLAVGRCRLSTDGSGDSQCVQYRASGTALLSKPHGVHDNYKHFMILPVIFQPSHLLNEASA